MLGTPRELRASVVSLAEAMLSGPAGVPDGTSLVAAVSGGADSVALAWALSELRQRWPLSAVAFIDHGLREVASERGAARQAALSAGVPFVERRLELAAGEGNLQARARAARYQALIGIAREQGDHTLLATGHTQSDQAETVLARILRGAGVAGLGALAPRRGRLVRPLLGVSRAVTRGLGLAFVDDPSNDTPRFQRNRVRSVVLAQLGAEQPAIEAALAHLAASARGATRLLDALAVAAPETALTGLDPAAVQAFLVHLGRVHGARGLERAPLEAWSRALIGGGLSAISLGEGLRGLARGGRAAVVLDDDPRQTVVAWRPGTYRGPSLELQITEVSPEHARRGHAVGAADPSGQGDAIACEPGEAYVREVAWPVRLSRAPRCTSGVFGDEVDLTTGAALGGWRVVDASGRTLVPAPPHAPGARPDLTAGTPSRHEAPLLRIVLKPFARAGAT